MRVSKLILAFLLLGMLLEPMMAQADDYNDSWRGFEAEGVYPWGVRMWESWDRTVPKKPYRIGVSIPSLGSPYFVNLCYGLLTEAQATGLGVTILAAKGYDDLQGQISQIENLVNQKIDALLVGPISAEGIAAITERVVKKGTPVYFTGEAAITDKISGYISENDYDYGYTGMVWLCQKLGGKGKIAILAGPAGNTYTEAINKGNHAALKRFPNIQVVAEKWGDAEDPAVGQEMAENILNANPDLNGFFVDEAQAHGVANVLKERKLTEKVYLVMTYPFQETLPYIMDGSIDYGITGHSITNMRIMLSMITRRLNGEIKVPKYIWTPGLEITKETVNNFPRQHVWAPEGWSPPSSMVVAPKKK